ncbi:MULTISPECIES: helix-turn-helix domain-containing protein [Mycobacteroides]|jgi:transcriptional regulator with XRE-family HTH domain|uniref:DNA binding protein n=1 Tax=Mycobacteroides abscessus subsp. abscessus TaxID=1185650 RepID=A0AB38D8G4_9MYCO|nr:MULTISPECIES: helix-turn-helix transcriptional regulator [Mycobacteroides]MBF9327957.1 helix-turn-helix transcriptional regulator [Mycobacteroides chelonae]MBF9422136.1 helix-turn-helix transcriptional regulator [Mycobacteroides chelonae]SIB99203.1 putative DNA binding protein [Mycobacteroides abscessus subsp. abscessus]SIC12551.1 putative DNA binding protein [Mycobacteroides abscessus subsp. abscessus]SIC22800.1 putative DNA binding protein [Mycobacteroides abscessus subsp. abscessus]
MGRKAIELGPTGRTVAMNIGLFRVKRGWKLSQLSERMTAVGRPMTGNTLSSIENHTRRADVDDLVAIAAALDVSPASLMMPPTEDDEDGGSTWLIHTSAEPDPGEEGVATIQSGQFWDWLTADAPLDAPLLPDTGRDEFAVEAWRRKQVPPFAYRMKPNDRG